MNSLDLHGVRHAYVRGKVIRFIEDNWGTMETLEIVTGHSTRMRELVIEVLNEYKAMYFIGGYLGINPAIITCLLV